MTLNQTLVTYPAAAESAAASVSHWALFLHGILGRGSNWQTFAKRLTEMRPDWGAILLDQRMHGSSRDLSPPHTMMAAIGDAQPSITSQDAPVRALIGHSFGGKVALGLLQARPADLRQVWVLDASPSARIARPGDDLIRRVLDALQALPATFANRAEFVAQLEARGIERSIAQWLAKNLERTVHGLTFAIDLTAIEALLSDHDRLDLWSVVEQPLADVRLHFVLGGRSGSVSRADRERLESLARRDQLELHVLPNAGHWLHVDDPSGLLELLRDRLLATAAVTSL
jgi:esterase